MNLFSQKLIQFLLLSCLISTLEAQYDDGQKMEIEKCARLESGFIFGNRIVNSEELYIPGGSIQYSYCLKSGDYLGIGLGVGVNLFKSEGLIPFYLDIIGMMKKDRNSPFVNLQTGYSFGWSNKFEDLQSPEFKGGFFIGIGLGKKFHIRDRFASYISLSYRHQLASVRYELEDQEEQKENINYNLLVFSIGVMLEQK
jgi:hypothetical protein